MALASTPGGKYSHRRLACATKAKAAMLLAAAGAAACPEAAARCPVCPGCPSLAGSGAPCEAIAGCLLRLSLAISASQSCRNLPTKGAEQPANGVHTNRASSTSMPANSYTSLAPKPTSSDQRTSTTTPGG
eukprot:38886-Pyramimonas_sp.AAC.1